MTNENKKKNSPVLRDDEDKKLYRKLVQSNGVRFRLTPEEHALLDAMMNEEEYINISEYIRTKLFADKVKTSVKRRLKIRDKWFILSDIKYSLQKLNNDYRYVLQVMPKDIKTALANQNVKQIIELDRKWLAKLQESTEEVNNNLLAIMYSLGIDTEGPIIKSNEDVWDNDPDEQKKARMIWELSNNQEK